jgi:hypothetical protein
MIIPYENTIQLPIGMDCGLTNKFLGCTSRPTLTDGHFWMDADGDLWVKTPVVVNPNNNREMSNG